MKLTHGELFAGIGGFGIGFDNAGAVTKWHVEIDKRCQSILSRHWPDAQIESDVCEVGKHNLSLVDIISFGSPCQDLSIAGKRKGFQDGTRSNLFFEAVRIIQELNPRYAVWENVPGALSSHGGRDFQSVLKSLLDTEVPMPRSGRWATAGMVRSGQKEIAWRVLDAQYFGVPQRRRRIFLIFCPRGDSAAEVLFESEGVSGNTPPSRKEVAYSLRANPSHSGDKGDGGINTTMVVGALSADDGERGMATVQAAMSGMLRVFDRQRSDEYGEAATVSTVAARDYKSASDLITTSWDSQRARIHDEKGTAPTLQSGGKTSGNIVPTICFTTRRTEYDGHENVSPTLNMGGGGMGAPAVWEMSHASEAVRENGEICPTLQGRMGTGGNQVPMVGVRRLTPTECLRLQGFSDNWLDRESDTAKYRQCGNAVAVPVVEWIAKRIVALT